MSPSPGDIPNPGIEPRSSALQVDSLPAEPPGKTKNTGVGSLSLSPEDLSNPESNRGLLHCRWILYQLSYQGSPVSNIVKIKDKYAKNSNLRHTSGPQQKYKVCEESGQAV